MKLAHMVLATAVLGVASVTQAALLYGLDAVLTSTSTAPAYNTPATSSGVTINNPTTLSNWLSGASASGAVTPAYGSAGSGAFNVLLNIPSTATTTTNNIDAIYKVDLTGSHSVTFDKFAVSFQRGGTASNLPSGAAYSTDGVNFTSTSLGRITDAQGSNAADTAAVGAPANFGGTIGRGQTYVVSGLGSAGALSSGSLWIKVSIGTSSSATAGLTTFNDRYDVSNVNISVSTANTTDTPSVASSDDGYDIAWYGSATALNQNPVVAPVVLTIDVSPPGLESGSASVLATDDGLIASLVRTGGALGALADNVTESGTNPAIFSLANLDYSDVGTYTFTYTATDNLGASGTGTLTVNIVPEPASLAAVGLAATLLRRRRA